jgi:hypothetical protein
VPFDADAAAKEKASIDSASNSGLMSIFYAAEDAAAAAKTKYEKLK